MSSTKKGMSLMEVVIGSAIMLTSMVSIIGVYGSLTSMSLRTTSRVQAAMLAEETAEVLRFMRDTSWNQNISTLANSTAYHLVWVNGVWVATTTPVTISNQFIRTFTLSTVNRDSTSYDIVPSGGTLDTGTRKATIEVSWLDGVSTSTRTAEMYIHNIFSN